MKRTVLNASGGIYKYSKFINKTIKMNSRTAFVNCNFINCNFVRRGYEQRAFDGCLFE